MTVIAALKHNGRVFMAADSMSSDHTGMIWDGSGKLFEKLLEDGTRLVMGNTGSAAVEGIIQVDDVIKVGPEKTDDQAWFQLLVMHYTQLCRDAHEVDKDGDANICLLVACGPDVWEITSNYAQRVDKYVAVGGGAQFAMGSMWNELDRYGAFYPPHDDETAEQIVHRAVQAACRWERSCREPVQLLST